MPYENLQAAVTALNQVVSDQLKDPAVNAEKLANAIANWVKNEFTSSEQDKKILTRIGAILHQDKFISNQAAFGFNKENFAKLKGMLEAEGKAQDFYFKAVQDASSAKAAPKTQSPEEMAREREEKASQMLKDEKAALENERKEINDILPTVTTFESQISEIVSQLQKELTKENIKSKLDENPKAKLEDLTPKAKELFDKLKVLVGELKISVEGKLREHANRNNPRAIAIVEQSVRLNQINPDLGRQNIQYIHQNIPVINKANQVLDKIKAQQGIVQQIQKDFDAAKEVVQSKVADMADKKANLRDYSSVQKELFVPNELAKILDLQISQAKAPQEGTRGKLVTGFASSSSASKKLAEHMCEFMAGLSSSDLPEVQRFEMARGYLYNLTAERPNPGIVNFATKMIGTLKEKEQRYHQATNPKYVHSPLVEIPLKASGKCLKEYKEYAKKTELPKMEAEQSAQTAPSMKMGKGRKE